MSKKNKGQIKIPNIRLMMETKELANEYADEVISTYFQIIFNLVYKIMHPTTIYEIQMHEKNQR